MTGEFPAYRASNAANVSIWWRHHVTKPVSYLYWYDNDVYQLLPILINSKHIIPNHIQMEGNGIWPIADEIQSNKQEWYNRNNKSHFFSNSSTKWDTCLAFLVIGTGYSKTMCSPCLLLLMGMLFMIRRTITYIRILTCNIHVESCDVIT